MVLASPLFGMLHSIMGSSQGPYLPLLFSIHSIHSIFSQSFLERSEDSLWFFSVFARNQIKILLRLLVG
jgi:hypothetical protein